MYASICLKTASRVLDLFWEPQQDDSATAKDGMADATVLDSKLVSKGWIGSARRPDTQRTTVRSGDRLTEKEGGGDLAEFSV